MGKVFKYHPLLNNCFRFELVYNQGVEAMFEDEEEAWEEEDEEEMDEEEPMEEEDDVW